MSCVSKGWNSLIHSPDFIHHYTRYYNNCPIQQQQRFYFITTDRYERFSVTTNTKTTYLSFVDDDDDDDDDTFSHNNKSSNVFVPDSVNRLNLSKVLGNSHGLLCLLGSFVKQRSKDMAVIWNPMIRKTVSIALPNVAYGPQGRPKFGFGVCPKTCDPKIVKINPKMFTCQTLEDPSCTNWVVEVFTLSSGVWRRIPSGKLLRKWLDFSHTSKGPVDVDGSIYWIVTETIDPFELTHIETLVSFDLTSEEFKQVRLPDNLLRPSPYYEPAIQIFKLRESLAIIIPGRERTHPLYEIWTLIMENNGAFQEVLTIDVGCRLSLYTQPVLRRNGQLITRVAETGQPVVCKPGSNQMMNYLGITHDDRMCSLHVSSNTESLLLLDQSDTLTVRGGLVVDITTSDEERRCED